MTIARCAHSEYAESDADPGFPFGKTNRLKLSANKPPVASCQSRYSCPYMDDLPAFPNHAGSRSFPESRREISVARHAALQYSYRRANYLIASTEVHASTSRSCSKSCAYADFAKIDFFRFSNSKRFAGGLLRYSVFLMVNLGQSFKPRQDFYYFTFPLLYRIQSSSPFLYVFHLPPYSSRFYSVEECHVQQLDINQQTGFTEGYR